MKKYIPNPIDASGISLSPALLELTEKLAKNVHENWAKKRMEEGWKYGSSRDGGEKTTPCLVSYEDLPEAEKEYDRSMALETIKLILKLGYTMQKEGEEKCD